MTTNNHHQKQMPAGQGWHQPDLENSLFDRAIESIREMASLTSMLRISGAVAVLISMSMFLLQGWSENNDFERFCIMLAQTGLLGMAGLAMAKLLKEAKGARLFFGLSLTSVTANFTTLAALIYSVFSWDQLAGDYASFALWQASSGGAALLSVGIALVVLVPLSWLAFSILARPMAVSLTKWYIGMNLLMLIPVRELVYIMPMVAIAVALLLNKSFLSKSALANNFSWNTAEGRYAQLILVLPLGIMIVRSLMSYNIAAMELLIIAGSVYAMCVAIAKLLSKQYVWLFHLTALASAVVFAHILTYELLGFGLPMFALVFGIACVDLYRRSQTDTMRSFFIVAISVVTALALVLQQLVQPTIVNAIYALVGGLLLLLFAHRIKSKLLFSSALVIFGSIPFVHFQSLFSFFAQSGWVGFAVGGVLVITLASVLDRYGSIIRLKFFDHN